METHQSMVAFLRSALSSAAVSDLRSASKTFLSFVLLFIDVDVKFFVQLLSLSGWTETKSRVEYLFNSCLAEFIEIDVYRFHPKISPNLKYFLDSESLSATNFRGLPHKYQ